MTINFADGTHIEIAATAFDGFVKHDLKWAEFVHGRAMVKKLACKESRIAPAGPDASSRTQCPSLPGGRLLSKPQNLTTDEH